MIIIDFLLGEKRRISVKVVSANAEPFYIQSAGYNVIFSTQTVFSGDCAMDRDENTLSFIFQPENVGRYILEFTYSIADEIFKERWAVNVT
jgi:hypothetical protein